MAVRSFLWALAACIAFSATPALAQSTELAEIDAMARAGQSPDAAMTLARQQIADSDLLGALATLERVLVAHPEDDDALMLHVALLCRVDDRQGARAELADMDRARPSEAAWGEVLQACGPMPRLRGWGG